MLFCFKQLPLITRAMSLFFSAISIHSRNFLQEINSSTHLNTSRFQFLHISRNNLFLNFILIFFFVLFVCKCLSHFLKAEPAAFRRLLLTSILAVSSLFDNISYFPVFIFCVRMLLLMLKHRPTAV